MNDQSTCETYDNGVKVWKLNNKLHRTDGPAVDYPDGTQAWYFNGKYHRADGPAIEYMFNNTKHWYYHGVECRIEDLKLWPIQLYLGYLKWMANELEDV